MKRVFLWTGGILLALVVVVVLAFRLSPWPSVALISMAFASGDEFSESRLVKHVPAGVVSRNDLAYGPGADEIFDINFPDEQPIARPTIVWVHGGGFIGGSKDGVANYLKVLAGHGYTVVGLEYSKGFGSTYPRPVEQVNAALGHLVADADELRIDTRKVFLAGDSAGAQIAAQVALLVTDPAYAAALGIAPAVGSDGLAGTILASGAFDLASVDLSGDYGWFVRTVLWAYTGVRDFMNDARFELASVPQHVGPGFPPTYITSGNGDPLAPQAVALASRLVAQGVDTESLFFPATREPALPHEYQFNLDDPAGQDSLARMLAFIARQVQALEVPAPSRVDQ